MSCDLLVTMGISGSGKSRKVQEYVAEGYEVICPDLIREELTGSIGDQSRNKEVFQIAFGRVRENLSEGKDTVFDSTATHPATRETLLQAAEMYNARAILLVFDDSLDAELCKMRVGRDIELGKNRSNVPEDVIDRQQQAFIRAREDINDEAWDVIYIES